MSQTEAVDLVRQGIALAQSGDRAQARPLLRQAVEQNPSDEAAWMWLAGAADSPQEALSALERVLALNPGNERARSAAHAARLQLGVSAARAGKKARARTLLKIVAAAEPENELAWMWLANVAEKPADAAACLEKVLALNPDNTLARSTLERCHAATARVRPAAAPAPAPVVAPPPAARKTVLVVIARSALREGVVEALRGGGHQTHVASDGYEAVDLLRDRGAPDLILLAAALPGGLDGYQLCKLLHENPTTARLPILLLSEKAGLFHRMRGGLAGAAAELAASCTAEELLAAVEQHGAPSHSH